MFPTIYLPKVFSYPSKLFMCFLFLATYPANLIVLLIDFLVRLLAGVPKVRLYKIILSVVLLGCETWFLPFRE